MNRRKFIGISIAAGASTSHWGNAASLLTGLSGSEEPPIYQLTREIAATPARNFRPYCSKPMSSPEVVSWVQIDLGSKLAIDAIRLYPAASVEGEPWPYPYCPATFPLRFKIEIADEALFQTPQLVVDLSQADYPDPKNHITEFPASGKSGRYVRITVNRMTPVPKQSAFSFVLSKVEVLSDGKDAAERCPASADPVAGNPEDLKQLTRPPRPQGEELVTDNPGNVTAASQWNPARYQANAPLSGVTLNGGLFQTVMENNIGYLLDSFTVDELLRQFRERAGKPLPPDQRPPDKFWDEDLAGSNAGRFLMGAGNTLRWIDHPQLRARLNQVVEGIDECKQSDGYIMAYPEDTIFYSERGAYTRAWLTHGLIEAGYSGNAKAFTLLRGNYDWFNQCAYLPQLLRRAGFGPQGMVANTRMHFTPVGKPEDIQVIQRYFQENYWMEDLASRKEEAIWQYPYDRPHCYEVTFFEAYMDLYRATGEKRYLDAMQGAWQLYHDNWEHVGGSTAIEEFQVDPPKSYRLDRRHGELCGTSFWVFFNQRFHLLNPEEERYVSEIEKSIYNVAIANQASTEGLRYFALLVGTKVEPYCKNTCCEGQGTRLLGALPEFIYSLAPDGVYVNLFEPSTLSWKGEQGQFRISQSTNFPASPEVRLHIAADSAVHAKIRIRVPAWAAHEMQIMVNGKAMRRGSPGSYVTLNRTWSDEDVISFTLPMKFKLTRYEGESRDGSGERYAIEYGPILMAVVGNADARLKIANGGKVDEFSGQLIAKDDQPLHYRIAGHEAIELMPYWQVEKQQFTCFPTVV